jgi:hypothetical protein
MLELTITSPYLIVDSEVLLFTPTKTNVSPIIKKMEQPIGKREGRGGS